MNEDSQEALDQLCQCLEESLTHGRAIEVGKLAEQFAVSVADVQDCLAALEALGSLSATHEESIPESLGAYTLFEELGRGGMGVVFRGRQPALDRFVAVKVLPKDKASEERRSRFRIEAHAIARLRHPNIVTVHDMGSDQGYEYLVLDLIEGRSLAERVRQQGPLSLKEAIDMARILAKALCHAHSKSILHRDITPRNVLLTADKTPLLMDFGLAKLTDSAPMNLTRTHQFMGTLCYVSPEQAFGIQDKVDRGTDIYGLGATLYYAITGQPPVLSKTAELSQLFAKAPKAPSSFDASLAPLDEICRRCLEREPEDRFANAQELLASLESVSLSKAPGPSALSPTSLVLILATLLVVLWSFAGGSAVVSNQSSKLLSRIENGQWPPGELFDREAVQVMIMSGSDTRADIEAILQDHTMELRKLRETLSRSYPPQDPRHLAHLEACQSAHSSSTKKRLIKLCWRVLAALEASPRSIDLSRQYLLEEANEERAKEALWCLYKHSGLTHKAVFKKSLERFGKNGPMALLIEQLGRE